MLTEIEWWGGLLFIWLGFCFIMMRNEYSDERTIGVGYLTLHTAYLSVGVLLAMYFYPLDTPLQQHIYLGTLVAATVFNLVFASWPDSELIKAKAAELDENESGIGTTIFGLVLFLTPVLTVFALAVHKCLEFQVLLTYLN